MSSSKEKNSVWYFLLLLPIASSALTTMGGALAVIGVICLVLWCAILQGSINAFNSGSGDRWAAYVPIISKFKTGSMANSSNGSPVIPNNLHSGISPNQTAQWDKNAPAYNNQCLTATLESLKWNNENVNAIACEAGENLQYALAFRCQHGIIMPHTQKIDSVQMSELATRIKGKLPREVICRAWPMYEVTKGINMDGLLIIPDKNKPLGLYLIVAGDANKSRFTVFSMFVPVCTGKAEWMKRVYRPSSAELKSEQEFINIILKSGEQIVS